MKALGLEEYNKLIYKDCHKPKIGLEDVLIKVKALLQHSQWEITF